MMALFRTYTEVMDPLPSMLLLGMTVLEIVLVSLSSHLANKTGDSLLDDLISYWIQNYSYEVGSSFWPTFVFFLQRCLFLSI
jgi:hypothetical protein|tara:strand:- start:128 stop:373 length:246 start_codon:yes stop_codon:yes gene_type:complete